MKKLISALLLLLITVPLVACNNGGRSYNIGNADRARVFYNTYNSFVEKYGEAKENDGTLCGTAVVRLYDFTGDGGLEMLIAYSSEKGGKVDSVMVCGFDMGYAELYNEKITSKASADAKDSTIWIYTDSSGLSYLVLGDDLSQSRSFNTYRQADSDGKALYKFAEAFSTDSKDLSGTYEKIDITSTDLSDIFDENENVIEALKTQKN